MKNILKANKKKYIYIIPSLIVMSIMMIIFKIKGMYPFGNIKALQMDADHNYVPTLFKIYDIFHNGDSILWDFKLGSGANIYGSLIMNSIYSPLNWLVILTKRTNIVDFFNILLIIKYMFMATIMFIFIRKNFQKVETYWQIILSLMYVFSGWVFLMYSNIFYIDTIILFPLIIHYLIKLFKENKNLGLIITLSYSLILNIYLSYMIYLFIIFSSLIAIILLIKKENRKKIIVNLSFSLVLPLIISSFSYLPTIVQVLSSVRTNTGEYNGYFFYFFLKFINLTMCSFIIFLFTKLIIKYKKNKETIFLIIIFILTTIGVIIEPINRIWHTGNYNAFPYRYSFIAIFIMICGSLKYISNETKRETQTNIKQKNIILIIIFCLFVISMFMLNFNNIIKKEMIGHDIAKPGIFIIMIILCILFLTCHAYNYKIKNETIKKIITSVLILIEVLTYSNYCYNNYNYHQSNQALEYEKNIQIRDDELYKYVDYQAGLGVNSSYITRNATLANWLHIIPPKQLDFIEKMGYSNQSMIIYGFGGTIFSDTLIGTKYVYSYLKLPDDIFTLKETFEYDDVKVYFYELEHHISFGFVYDNKFDDSEYESPFETQNYYYKKLFNTEKEIINIKEFTKYNEQQPTYKIENSENVILYLEVTKEILESNIKEMIINNETITLGNSEKIVYIAQYDSDINIEIKTYEDKKINFNNIKFGYIKLKDYEKFEKQIQTKYNIFEFKKNKLHINIDSEKEQYLFLPINNIDGWNAKLNGETIKIEDEMYTFMSIKLSEGNNDVELEFIPPYLEEGIIISIIGLILTTLYMMLKNKIEKIIFIQKTIIFLYYVISISLLIFVYIISNFIFI